MTLCDLRRVRSCVIWVVLVALILQPCTAMAAVNASRLTTPEAASRPVRTADVALNRDGVLLGQVVNDAGVGVADAVVEITNGRQHWQTKTDTQGWFQVVDMRGGTYQFQAAGQSQVLRVWASGTAPPSASRGILVTPSNEVFRGQRSVSPNTNQFFRVAKQRLANPWVFGGIVATAVAVPVAIHNANADADNPPASP